MSDIVLIEVVDDVATVTVNRPDKLNALNQAVIAQLTETFASLTVRAAVLTGAGKAFVAGADIAAMAEMSPTEAYRFAMQGRRLGEVMERADFPIIAAVNGFALGGGLERPLARDFI